MFKLRAGTLLIDPDDRFHIYIKPANDDAHLIWNGSQFHRLSTDVIKWWQARLQINIDRDKNHDV